MTDKASFQLEAASVKLRETSLAANNKYLESKLAETLTLKEEQNIKLKSEIVIHKAKVESLKLKLAQDGGLGTNADGDRVGELRQQMSD